MWIIYHQLRPSQVKHQQLVASCKQPGSMNFQNQQLEDATFSHQTFKFVVCVFCVCGGNPSNFLLPESKGKIANMAQRVIDDIVECSENMCPNRFCCL